MFTSVFEEPLTPAKRRQRLQGAPKHWRPLKSLWAHYRYDHRLNSLHRENFEIVYSVKILNNALVSALN